MGNTKRDRFNHKEEGGGGMEKNQSTENKHTPPFTPPVLGAIQTLIGEPGSILTEYLEGEVHCFDIGLL